MKHHAWVKFEDNKWRCRYCNLERYRHPYNNSTLARHVYAFQDGVMLMKAPDCEPRLRLV